MPIKDYLRIGGLCSAMALALALHPAGAGRQAEQPAGQAQVIKTIAPAPVEISPLPQLPPRQA